MSDLSFPTMTSLLLILGLAALVIGIILFFKSKFNSMSPDQLGEKYRDTTWKSPLTARSKYPAVNAFKLSNPLLLFGLVASLATTILAFSATTYDDEVFIPDDALELDEDFLVEPPRTAEPPPPPPPPPPPVIEEVPEEEIEEEEEPVFEDTTVDEETVAEEVEPVIEEEEEAPPPPPPPPPPTRAREALVSTRGLVTPLRESVMLTPPFFRALIASARLRLESLPNRVAVVPAA